MKLKTHSELEEQIQREPLRQRLERCIDIIGRLASEGRPPKMSIPVQASDEDVFLTTTIQDAATFRATVADALPESWYADSPVEFRIQKMAEQWQKLHKREKEVAAALRELLSTVAGLPVADYSTDGDGAELVRQDSVIAAVKTAITALGLAEKEQQ